MVVGRGGVGSAYDDGVAAGGGNGRSGGYARSVFWFFCPFVTIVVDVTVVYIAAVDGVAVVIRFYVVGVVASGGPGGGCGGGCQGEAVGGIVEAGGIVVGDVHRGGGGGGG